jgi:hypothetical protein
VLFVAVPPFGAPIVYDEIWRACTADELAEEITRRTAGRTVGFMKADPKAWEEDPVYRVSMAQRFHAHGLPVEPASKAKSFGILNMNSLFRQRLVEPATGLKRPFLYFSPTVKRTLWELARYHYDKENKPIDKDDHFMECMYRLFIVPLVHVDPSASRQVPDFDLPMTRSALSDFDVDRLAFDASVGSKF